MALVRCKSCGHDNSPEARFCATCGSNLVATIEQSSPVVVPSAAPAVPVVADEYMGFWIRSGATIIDVLVISFISFALSRLNDVGIMFAIFLPWLYYWLFTGFKGRWILPKLHPN